jgi:hypothetical protein
VSRGIDRHGLRQNQREHCFHYLEAAARRCRFSLCASIASAPELNASQLLWPGYHLLALLLSAGLLSRALKRHRFRAATFHSSRILP